MHQRLAERVRIEHTPRHKCRGNGFEDREGHQAPITLPLENPKSATRNPKWNRSAFLTDGFDNGIRIGELACRILRVDLLSIDRNLKHAAAGRNQLERADVLFEFQEFFRQTDGLGLVVSSRAILDGDVQGHNDSMSAAQ